MSSFRSGFVGILGRPNVGKSTLLNALCGEKVSIVSDKPQTTRNRVMGVRHGDGYQAVFIDTPGIHEWERALNRYMAKVIADVMKDVDVAVYVVDAARSHGREDELALGLLPTGEGSVPVILAVNKADAVSERTVRDRIAWLESRYAFRGVHVVSALKGAGLQPLLDRVAGLLPEGVPYFPEDMVTDQPLGFVLAEMIREKIFAATRDEIPFATAVVVEEISTREDGLLEVSATVYVERESQKRIIIGKGGRLLRAIGIQARAEMEQKMGRKVYLSLWVKVKKGWTDRESLLRQLGYT